VSQAAQKFKWLTVVFVVLTVVFAATTGYFLTNPVTTTQTISQTESQTVTATAVSTFSSSPYSVNIAYSPTIGFYLTNGTGWTLYLLETDTPGNGTSTCTGECMKFWPAFYTETLNLPPGLQASSFGEITRPDGSKQITYNGWPLYQFINDMKPGDTYGEGVKGVWFAYPLPTPSEIVTTTTSTTSNSMGG
jgi:predicted lipoprotein with Yx(FWY)xxD motif